MGDQEVCGQFKLFKAKKNIKVNRIQRVVLFSPKELGIYFSNDARNVMGWGGGRM